MESKRKLAHVEVIESLSPIIGADKIEVAKVLGWECVVKKGEFTVGDKIIYIEVDSVMPKLPVFDLLKDRNYRVRTIKLRGQISQGLVLPLHAEAKLYTIGKDVTEELGITKYLSKSEQEEITKQIVEQNRLKKFMMRYSWFRRLFLSRNQKEGFPYWVSKTDEERIQNISKVLKQFKDKEVYVTEKIDYQSVTFTGKIVPRFNGIFSKLPFKKFQFVVCSRNLTTNDKNSLYWKIAQKYNIEQILKENPNLTIQGEQGDTKVQGNKYSITEPTMWVFNIIDHEKNYHYNRREIALFCANNNLQMVPQLYLENDGFKRYDIKLSELGTTVQELIEFSKGKSMANPNVEREGIVVRCIENGEKLLSFKVINPEFLLKYED